MSERLDTFAVCQPGIEPLAEAELAKLGVKVRVTHGGLIGSMTWRQLALAHLHLRTVTRVLVRVARFDATTWIEFTSGLHRIEWSRWLPQDAALDVRVASSGSKLYHTGAIEERVRAVVPSGRGAPEGLLVRLNDNLVTVSLDASGEALFRRGWRAEATEAPMRETLAAALVMWSGWDPKTPLVDPCAGSGTIAIEAAMLARRMPPGRQRSFAWQSWPGAAAAGWDKLVAAADADVLTREPVVVMADVDAEAMELAQRNAERAGVQIDARVSDAAALELPRRAGWVVTNPPYGARLKSDLRPLYEAIGRLAVSPWHLAVVAATGTPTNAFGRQWVDNVSTQSGGLPVRFLRTA